MCATHSAADSLKSLIIVCCHAIYLPEPTDSNPDQPFVENNWLLAEFQRSKPGKEGEHLTFIKHLSRAYDLAKPSPTVRVVVSGGATKHETKKSEAQGYLDALLTIKHDAGLSPQGRTGSQWLIDDNATDSFQNILFSLLKYHEVEGCWPSHITVVTHSFKTERIKHHLRAVKWPKTGFSIEGIDPPFAEAERRAVEGFEQRCLDEWKDDLYGVRPPLSEKRAQRLWRPRSELFNQLTSDTTVRQLLEWDGGDNPSEVFAQKLPWEQQ